MKNKLFNRSLFKISLLLLTITFLLILGCKKDKVVLSDIQLKQKAKEWFQLQHAVSYSPSWEKATLTRLGSNNFIILPSNITISDAKTAINSLLVINVSDEGTNGNIIELFNLESDNIHPDNEIISNYLTYGDKSKYPFDLNINLLLFDVEHKFLKGSAFVDGILKWDLGLMVPTDLKFSQLLMNNKVQSLMTDRNRTTKEKACYDYYLVYRDLIGALIESYYLYSSCDDGGSNAGGSGSSSSNTTSDSDVPNVEPSESDYRYTCPDNFEFSSVTTNGLWQEGELTNIYCNLGIYDYMTGTISNSKTIVISALSFGLPYNNVNGGLIYTKNQAKAISADALNMAEEDMRKKYKSNPYLTSGQLADYWISRMNIRMKELTSNKGRVGRTGSINPSQTPPTKAYNPC